jgi:hypothetical protein
MTPVERRRAVGVRAVGEDDDDAALDGAVERIEAGIERVVQPRGVAGVEAVDVGGEAVAVRGEFAAELHDVVERADAAGVAGKQARHERSRRRTNHREPATHARARVEHHHGANRHDGRVEKRQRLLTAVVEDLEIVFREVQDNPVLRVDDGGRHRDEARVDLEHRTVGGADDRRRAAEHDSGEKRGSGAPNGHSPDMESHIRTLRQSRRLGGFTAHRDHRSVARVAKRTTRVPARDSVRAKL